MTITFIGHGYVGLVTATVFADFGNTVYVIGHTPEKIENLKKGIIPIYEPGLEEMVKRNLKDGRLFFTLDYKPAISESDIVFIAVGTPSKENGEADLSVVFDVAKEVTKHLSGYTVLVTKSTVPVGTNKKIREIVEKYKQQKSEFDIASIPEFLREGQAISDTLHPDRVVIGTVSKRAQDLLVKLHKPIDGTMFLTDLQTAEMVKYASNAFLATKISFANAIAQLSELTGANGVKVLKAVGLDSRIGISFLHAGAGYGGSCFPKDVKALISIAKQRNFDFGLLKEVENVNNAAMMQIVDKTKKMLNGNLEGSKIAILGLSFKPDTDDMRDAPSITIIEKLCKMGASIRAYDPIAMENAKKIFNDLDAINFCASVEDAVREADLVVILTEWNEFMQLDLSQIKKLMRVPRLLDGRNIYDPFALRNLGFEYMGVGQ